MKRVRSELKVIRGLARREEEWRSGGRVGPAMFDRGQFPETGRLSPGNHWGPVAGPWDVRHADWSSQSPVPSACHHPRPGSTWRQPSGLDREQSDEQHGPYSLSEFFRIRRGSE